MIRVFRRGALLACVAGSAIGGMAAAQETEPSTCVTCHAKESAAIVEAHRASVHAAMPCTECHGGDPAGTTEVAAHSEALGYKGKIDGVGASLQCAECHGDAARMKPLGIDPTVAARWTGASHGQRVASGAAFRAGCTDCHGTHDVLSPRDPKSPTHHANVPDMCATCHSHAERMGDSKLPTDQHAEFFAGAHGKLLLSENPDDRHLAPSCTDCHGAHGSKPPDAQSVPAVCNKCHFEEHRYVTRGLHFAALRNTGSPSCVDCHDNHRTDVPGSISETCGKCHDAADERARAAVVRLDELLVQARARVEWLEALIAVENGHLGANKRRLLAAELERVRGIHRRVQRVSHSVEIRELEAAMSGLEENVKTVTAITRTELDGSEGFSGTTIAVIVAGVVLLILVFSLVIARLLARLARREPAGPSTAGGGA